VSAPRSFRDVAAFRAWLAKHHDRESELILRLFKVHASHRGIGYREALDEALCWGWIDGVRRALDADSFTQRFTPRRARSVWSNVNVKRVRELEAEGRMAPPGLAAFRARDAARTGIYAFEQRPDALPPELERVFRAKPRAWRWYAAQAPWYRRATIHWVSSAKREATRRRRLATLIEHSANGRPIPPLDRTGTARRAPARTKAKPAAAVRRSPAQRAGGSR
jgi:uncharacterized protein YdeI (YjbR/CyaY-like superfamily)